MPHNFVSPMVQLHVGTPTVRRAAVQSLQGSLFEIWSADA
jgi:hypothetical protein